MFPAALLAQKAPTYYENIKPIIDDNCVVCHRQGEAVPFTLETYTDVSRRATFIKQVTQSGYMPPWFADTEVQHYRNERGLSEEEIATIAAWVDAGKPEGKRPKAKKVANTGPDYPEPDLELPMVKPFDIPGDNTEQFRIFVIPTGVEEERYVRGIDFRPGNLTLAHHSRLMIDTTNLLRPDDGKAAGDPDTEFTRRNVQLADYFWHGWVPGNYPVFYPEGVGKRLPKNADIVVNMHYSPSPRPDSDRSTVRVYFCEEKPRRLVETFILDEDDIVNQPFVIPANTVQKFTMRSPIIPYDITLLSVLPHMHLLGRNFKAYAVTPKGEVIFLIKIDDWNFNWQMTYQFERPIKLPKGSIIFAEAVYDNTQDNLRNPFDPARDATYGWGTYNEMMNLIFEYLKYEEGDEERDFYGRGQ